MSATTKIEWTNRTWNPLRGCSQVSAGCRNCYAMRLAHRYSGEGMPFEGLTKRTPGGPVWTGKIMPVEKALRQPLTWKKPARVFVNSMSDLFHEDVPFHFIDRVFTIMLQAPQHTFQILTKRPLRARQYLTETKMGPGPWPLPNVHLGVSVEDQRTADERISLLLQTPAAVRWVSMEPLLGPVNLNQLPIPDGAPYSPLHFSALHEQHDDCMYSAPALLDWVVVGGESGPGARPMHPSWARSLRDQCQAAGVAFFFKQWGEWAPLNAPAVQQIPMGYFEARDKGKIHNWDAKEILSANCSVKVGKKDAGRLLDGREWNEYPEGRSIAT